MNQRDPFLFTGAMHLPFGIPIFPSWNSLARSGLLKVAGRRGEAHLVMDLAIGPRVPCRLGLQQGLPNGCFRGEDRHYLVERAGGLLHLNLDVLKVFIYFLLGEPFF